MHTRILSLTKFVLAVTIVTACESDKTTQPSTVTYKATLTAANEVLANGSSAGVVSNGTGTWTGTFDPSANTLTWTMTFSGLTSNATLSHIHGQAPTTTTANVVLNFGTLAGSLLQVGSTSGTASGSLNLSSGVQTGLTITGDSLKKAIDAGQAYVNVHTVNFGAGEIRGQIVKQ